MLGEKWRQCVNAGTRLVPKSPGVYVGSSCLEADQSVVAMAAEGRRAALDISRRLGAATRVTVRQ